MIGADLAIAIISSPIIDAIKFLYWALSGGNSQDVSNAIDDFDLAVARAEDLGRDQITARDKNDIRVQWKNLTNAFNFDQRHVYRMERIKRRIEMLDIRLIGEITQKTMWNRYNKR